MTVRTPLAALFALFLIAAEPFDRTVDSTGSGDIIAFIGEQVFTERDEEAGFERVTENGVERRILISMDTIWESRFRVLEVIQGEFEHPTIDFRAYDHYGQPRYSKHEGAILLYLHDTDDGWVHDKYNFTPLYPTASGDWATCGQSFYEGREMRIPNPEPETILFDPPVIIDVSKRYMTLEDALEPYDRDEQEAGGRLTRQEFKDAEDRVAKHNQSVDETYKAPVYQRFGDEAQCKRGLRLQAVLDHMQETRFRPRKVTAFCETQHPYTSDWSDKPAREATNAGRKACFERLIASNWPYED